MAEKHSVSISDRLYSELKEYCQLNDLKLNIFVEDLIRSAFNVERYGETPFSLNKDETPSPKKEILPPAEDYRKVLETAKKLDKIIDGIKEGEEEMAAIVESTTNIEDVREAVDNLVFENKTVEEPKKKRKITRLN